MQELLTQSIGTLILTRNGFVAADRDPQQLVVGATSTRNGWHMSARTCIGTYKGLYYTGYSPIYHCLHVYTVVYTRLYL